MRANARPTAPESSSECARPYACASSRSPRLWAPARLDVLARALRDPCERSSALRVRLMGALAACMLMRVCARSHVRASADTCARFQTLVRPRSAPARMTAYDRARPCKTLFLLQKAGLISSPKNGISFGRVSWVTQIMNVARASPYDVVALGDRLAAATNHLISFREHLSLACSF